MTAATNHLIDLLPRAARAQLQALCEPVRLMPLQVLGEPGSPMRHVYFPTAGIVSLVAPLQGSPGVEVGMVGREGMVGAHVALGVLAPPWRCQVLGPGTACRVSTVVFRKALARSDALRRGLNRYLYVVLAQQATAAACVRFHLIDQRLARWLLMSQDRAGSDGFHVTHELLATLLGVRRAGVTTAASRLQRSGLIEYHRGDLRVLDRQGLEVQACVCYDADRKSYSSVLGARAA